MGALSSYYDAGQQQYGTYGSYGSTSTSSVPSSGYVPSGFGQPMGPVGQPVQQQEKKAGFFDKIKATVKGAVKGVVGMVKSLAEPKNLLMMAAGIGLVIATGGAATPFLIAIGAGMGAMQIAKSAPALAQGWASGDTALIEEGAAGVTQGTVAVAASVAGARGYAAAKAGGSAGAAAEGAAAAKPGTWQSIKTVGADAKASARSGWETIRNNGTDATAWRSTASSARQTATDNLTQFADDAGINWRRSSSNADEAASVADDAAAAGAADDAAAGARAADDAAGAGAADDAAAGARAADDAAGVADDLAVPNRPLSQREQTTYDNYQQRVRSFREGRQQGHNNEATFNEMQTRADWLEARGIPVERVAPKGTSFQEYVNNQSPSLELARPGAATADDAAAAAGSSDDLVVAASPADDAAAASVADDAAAAGAADDAAAASVADDAAAGAADDAAAASAADDAATADPRSFQERLRERLYATNDSAWAQRINTGVNTFNTQYPGALPGLVPFTADHDPIQAYMQRQGYVV